MATPITLGVNATATIVPATAAVAAAIRATSSLRRRLLPFFAAVAIASIALWGMMVSSGVPGGCFRNAMKPSRILTNPGRRGDCSCMLPHDLGATGANLQLRMAWAGSGADAFCRVALRFIAQHLHHQRTTSGKIGLGKAKRAARAARLNYWFCLETTGRDDWIRTSDPHTPSVMRYQAALRPVTSGAGPIGSASGRRKRRLGRRNCQPESLLLVAARPGAGARLRALLPQRKQTIS